MSTPHTVQFLSSLRKTIVEAFNTDELRLLCAELNIDYENLGSGGKEIIVLELINYLDRRGNIDELLKYCQRERPGYAWPAGGASLAAQPKPALQGVEAGKIVILFLAADPTNETRLR